MADENARFVAFVDRCRRFEAKSSQFFDAFDSLIVLTICSHAYISRSGDFRDDDDDRRKALPLAHARGVMIHTIKTALR